MRRNEDNPKQYMNSTLGEETHKSSGDDDEVANPADKPQKVPTTLRWILVFIFTVLVTLITRTFLVEPFVIPSGSMCPTLEIGDMLIGEKVSYMFKTPKQNDIVTFVDPTGSSAMIIKRVIAVAGQTVDIHDGTVYVDGEPFQSEETTERLDTHARNLDENISYPYVVPKDSLWVMGDNRDNSLDSRYFGAIDVSSVTSRAAYIYWPLSDSRQL